MPLVALLLAGAPAKGAAKPLEFTLEWQVLDHGLDTNTTTETYTVHSGHVRYDWHHTGYQAKGTGPRTRQHTAKTTDEQLLRDLLEAVRASPRCAHPATASEDDVVRARYSLYACIGRGKNKKGHRCYEGDLYAAHCDELAAFTKLKEALHAQAQIPPDDAGARAPAPKK